MDKFRLIPQSAGYATTPPEDAVMESNVPGGLPRLSADIEGGAHLVDVTILMDAGDWQYSEAFFRNRTGDESEPFLIDLILAGSDIAEYTAQLKAGSKRLVGAVANTRTVAMQLWVLPLETDEDADTSIVDIYEASNGEMHAYVDGFAEILDGWPQAI